MIGGRERLFTCIAESRASTLTNTLHIGGKSSKSCKMACATCGQTKFRKLRGPAGASPKTGWAIRALPTDGTHLQSTWDRIRPEASGPDDAVSGVVQFLQANSVPASATHIEEIGFAQWCDDDRWACGQGRRSGKEKIKGARAFWDKANYLMALVSEENARETLLNIFEEGTQIVNGPGGCKVCAAHWSLNLANHPVGDSGSRKSYREHLVFLHNATRERLKPVPYAYVAHKFNWKD